MPDVIFGEQKHFATSQIQRNILAPIHGKAQKYLVRIKSVTIENKTINKGRLTSTHVIISMSHMLAK